MIDLPFSVGIPEKAPFDVIGRILALLWSGAVHDAVGHEHSGPCQNGAFANRGGVRAQESMARHVLSCLHVGHASPERAQEQGVGFSLGSLADQGGERAEPGLVLLELGRREGLDGTACEGG